MKEDSNNKDSSQKKSKKLPPYDLSLSDKSKQVPVKLVDLDERSNDGKFFYQPTSTLLDPINAKQSTSDVSVLDIGFDTEYLTPERLRTMDGSFVDYVDDLSHNYLISTQFYVHYTEFNYDDLIDGKSSAAEAINHPVKWSGFLLHNPFRWNSNQITVGDVKANRISFTEFVHLILAKGFKEGHINHLPKEIQLFAHTNIADLDKFRDLHVPQVEGGKCLFDYLTQVRRSYASNGDMLLIADSSVEDSPTIKCKIDDTINLTPMSGGLASVGEIVDKEYPNEDLKKLQLGFLNLDGKKVRAIENMGELAIEDFSLFYRYAMQDARIPVFFIKKVREIQATLFTGEVPIEELNLAKSPSDKREVMRRYLKDFYSHFNTKPTLTSIGADYLRTIVWKNKSCSFYKYQTVVDSRRFYNKSYRTPNKPNTSLNWQTLIGKKGDTSIQPVKGVDGKGKQAILGFKPSTTTKYFDSLIDWMPLIKECYYGGRNEQYFFGVSPKESGTVFDYDLVSAYPTAMLCVGRVNWLKPINHLNPDGSFNMDIIRDWKNYASYFAVESFEFPEDVLYPTIPVRNKDRNGIIFPRCGGPSQLIPDRSFATRITGVEIDTAIRLGAKIKLSHGVVFEMDSSFLPYKEFIRTTITQRREAEKSGNDMMKLFWKEMMNSVYGKTAQGISDKKTFDIHARKGVALEESKITSYPLVGIVTAIVRAVLGILMNEIHKKHPNTFIGNITTDGFATNFPNNEDAWQSISQSPLVQHWLNARSIMENRPINKILNVFEDVDGKSVEVKMMIEQKHKVERYVGWRTRGQATLHMELNTPDTCRIVENDHLEKDDVFDKSIGFPSIAEQKKIMSAKGGQRTPLRGKANENVESVWWFLHRFSGLKYSLSYLNGLRGQTERKEDAINIESYRSVSMDFDLKRMPILSTFQNVELEHLDVLDKMNFRWTKDKSKTDERFSYFYADFVDIEQFDDNDWNTRKRNIKCLTFFTKPIKDLDEFETIREYWKRYRKANHLPNETKEDSQYQTTEQRLEIPFEEWNSIRERAVGNIKTLKTDEDGEYFLAKVDGKQTTCRYHEFKERFESHLNNDGIMNSVFRLQKFLDFYRSSIIDSGSKSTFYGNNKGGSPDIYRKVVNALCLARSLDIHGLDNSVGLNQDGDWKKLSKPDFYWYVWNVFYDEQFIRKEKKLLNIPHDEYVQKAKNKIVGNVRRLKSEFLNIEGISEKWGGNFLRTATNLILNHLEEIRNNTSPNMDVDVFLGKKSFIEGLDKLVSKPKEQAKSSKDKKRERAMRLACEQITKQHYERLARHIKELRDNPDIADLLVEEWEGPDRLDDNYYP